MSSRRGELSTRLTAWRNRKRLPAIEGRRAGSPRPRDPAREGSRHARSDHRHRRIPRRAQLSDPARLARQADRADSARTHTRGCSPWPRSSPCALLIWGFYRYRAEGLIVVWTPPLWSRWVAILLMWPAFVAFACMNPAPSRDPRLAAPPDARRDHDLGAGAFHRQRRRRRHAAVRVVFRLGRLRPHRRREARGRRAPLANRPSPAPTASRWRSGRSPTRR